MLQAQLHRRHAAANRRRQYVADVATGEERVVGD